MHDSVLVTRAIAGFAAGALVGGAAWMARALTRSGAVAAAVLGGLAVTAGWSWGVLLVAYFVASAALTRLRSGEKRARAGAITEKPGARDAMQVAANGAWFGVACVAFIATGHPLWQAVASAALAASAADTWATEVGVLSAEPPRSILTWRVVPVGTSGGVTVYGFMAMAAGAVWVAALAWVARWPAGAILSAVAGGLAGGVADSLLGATVQSRRRCPRCGSETERRVHDCGSRCELVGGVSWLDNDGVNALSTVIGVAIGIGAAQFI